MGGEKPRLGGSLRPVRLRRTWKDWLGKRSIAAVGGGGMYPRTVPGRVLSKLLRKKRYGRSKNLRGDLLSTKPGVEKGAEIWGANLSSEVLEGGGLWIGSQSSLTVLWRKVKSQGIRKPVLLWGGKVKGGQKP